VNSAFAHYQHIRRNLLHQFDFKPSFEGVQVSVVDSNQCRFKRQGLFQFIFVVYLDQNIQPASFSQIEKLSEQNRRGG